MPFPAGGVLREWSGLGGDGKERILMALSMLQDEKLKTIGPYVVLFFLYIFLWYCF